MHKLKNLKGLSGCTIELWQHKNGKYLVKKVSASIAYNKRLIAQLEKQQKFSLKGIETPEIYEKGYDENGLFYFFMEYIHGVTMAEYLRLNNFKKTLDVFDLLLDHVLNGCQTAMEYISSTPVADKIDELILKLPDHTQLLQRMKRSIPSSIPKSQPHGDLTFENVMIGHNNHIYFIDFLDGFAETAYADIGKLNQELGLYWSVRFDHTPDLVLLYNKLNEHFQKISEERGVNKQTSIFFSLLSILRILPYTNNPLETDLINKKIQLWQAQLAL